MSDSSANIGEIAVNATLNLNTILGEAPVEVKEMVSLSMALSACMAAQNEVTAQQEKSLLELALAVNEVFKLAPPERSTLESILAEESRIEDTFTPLLARFGAASEKYQQAAAASQAALNHHAASQSRDTGTTQPHVDPDNFRASSLSAVYGAVAEALVLTIQNAVATQQALSALGSPVLASAVNMIMALAGDDPAVAAANPGAG
jgi:hypothetical protein